MCERFWTLPAPARRALLRFKASALETSHPLALGRIEDNYPVHQLDDDRLAVGQLVIGFRPGAAEWPQRDIVIVLVPT